MLSLTKYAWAAHLEYEKLIQAVEQHAPYEYSRKHGARDTVERSLAEQDAAEQLAIQYMLMCSLTLQDAATTGLKELWSKRYTKAASEIYGLPDVEVAQRLSNTHRALETFEVGAEELGKYLRTKYAPVFQSLETDETTATLKPGQVASLFEKALHVLAENYDNDWNDWRVVRCEEKDSLSVIAGDKKILVGLQRANMKSKQLEPLFAHEVLIHAQRGLNGAKRGKELQTGLPGYLDFEEGLGVFVEYALSGEVSEKNIDRYLDIAYALGQLDGVEHTRQELLDRTFKRANTRNEKFRRGKSTEDITKEVYAHVNRIYRGSLGNKYIGIFTKDIAYYKGFLETGGYITAQLEAGKTIEGIMSFILEGKFDPTHPQHIQFIGKSREKVS